MCLRLKNLIALPALRFFLGHLDYLVPQSELFHVRVAENTKEEQLFAYIFCMLLAMDISLTVQKLTVKRVNAASLALYLCSDGLRL